MTIYEIMEVVFTWHNILALIAGCIYGLMIGILPGIGTAAGMALFFPLAMRWPAVTGLIFFAAVMRCNNYGGSITAIMLNTPGDVASCLTLLDGYAMTEKGRSVEALALSAMAAVVGGIIGIIVLMLFSPLLAEFALKFGPAEYFLVAILALSIISSMVKGNAVKGLISTGMGLTLATAGYDQITATLRFGFGLEFLDDGVPFVPVLVGLFAMAQALTLSESTMAICKIGKLSGSFWEGAKTYFKYPATIIRSTLVGLWFGVLPAVGASSAVAVAYTDALRSSKHPETFGTGEPAGVIAPETASNACMPGDLVCTLSLGIPGSIGAAVLMSIMIAYGVVPGPLVFVEKAAAINGLFFGLILATFFIVIVGFGLVRYLARISLIPNEIIVPAILVVCLLGSYASRNNVEDVLLTTAFGIIGYVMKKTGFNPMPLVLGLILGEMVETNFHRALQISNGDYAIFWASPFSKILIVLTVLSLVSPYLNPTWNKMCHVYQSMRGIPR
jgi:putative tricarboxylic transport membrane protein